MPTGSHYFLEMNTRLQVEHGVTELVTGLDLVAWQIRVAAGERAPDEVLDAAAQRPRHRGPPLRRGPVRRLPAHRRPDRPRGSMPDGPGSPGRRRRSRPRPTCRPEYDPLLAKLMVHAEDRPAAVDRLRRALDETLIGGLQTDAGFLRWLVDDEAFVGGTLRHRRSSPSDGATARR